MFEVVERGTARPGLASRPSLQKRPRKPDGSEDPINTDEVRMRLLESAIYEAGDALSATVDELFDALLRTIDRLSGKGGPGCPCQSCGHITEYGRFCTESCKAHWHDCQPDERRNNRRRQKASTLV